MTRFFLLMEKQYIYSVSVMESSFNVYSFPIDNPATVKQESSFSTHPVRFLSQSKDGLLAYTYNGELYTQRPGQKPSKVNVAIVLDEENPLEQVTVGSSSGAVASPDGKWWHLQIVAIYLLPR